MSLIAALLLASAATPSPQQWLCAHTTSGLGGSSVYVGAYLSAEGKMSQSVSWTPAETAENANKRQPRDGSNLSLSVSYDEGGAAGMGLPTNVLISTITERPVRWLEQGQATMTFADGTLFQAAIKRQLKTSTTILYSGDFHPIGNVDASSNLNSRFDGTGLIKVEVRDKSGKLRLQRQYILSGREERETLFHAAWSAVESASKTPEKCDLLVDDPGLEFNPPLRSPIP